MAIPNKLPSSVNPRLELQYANYIAKTLNPTMTADLEKLAHLMSINANWPGRDFKQLSVIYPMLLKMTNGLDIENLALDELSNYYPEYWKLWNHSIDDVDNIDGITHQDYVNYLGLMEQHFNYTEADVIKNNLSLLTTNDENGVCLWAKQIMLNPDNDFYHGIKSYYLTKVNALLWGKISANSKDSAYLAKLKLKNV